MGHVNPYVDVNADDPSLEQVLQTPMKVSNIITEYLLWIGSVYIFYNFFPSCIFRIVQKKQLKHVMEQKLSLKMSWEGNLIM